MLFINIILNILLKSEEHWGQSNKSIFINEFKECTNLQHRNMKSQFQFQHNNFLNISKSHRLSCDWVVICLNNPGVSLCGSWLSFAATWSHVFQTINIPNQNTIDRTNRDDIFPLQGWMSWGPDWNSAYWENKTFTHGKVRTNHIKTSYDSLNRTINTIDNIFQEFKQT